MVRHLHVGRVLARIGLHLLAGVLTVLLRFPFWTIDRRHAAIRDWSRGALQIFGMTVVARGAPASRCAIGRLIVANHTSWLDVIALFVTTDAVFVAKSDLEKWPIIGWLATRLGTIFLERRTTRDLTRGVAVITERLSRGTNVIVFPEGTTTDGTRLLPFRAALFAAVVNARSFVQPVAITYRRGDGQPASETAFVGDMSMLGSFVALATTRDTARGTAVHMSFLTEYPSAGLSRQALASHAEASIRHHLSLASALDAFATGAHSPDREAA